MCGQGDVKQSSALSSMETIVSHVDSVSGDIKAIHRDIKSCISSEGEVDRETMKKWKKELANTYRTTGLIKQTTNAMDERHKIEFSIMKEEMRDELVLREAIAARTAERFRVLNERASTGDAVSPFDRALHTAASIDAAIGAIGCHVMGVNKGTEFLHRQAHESV